MNEFNIKNIEIADNELKLLKLYDEETRRYRQKTEQLKKQKNEIGKEIKKLLEKMK